MLVSQRWWPDSLQGGQGSVNGGSFREPSLLESLDVKPWLLSIDGNIEREEI